MSKYRKLLALVIAPITAPLGYVAFLVAASGFDWPFNRTDIWAISVVATAFSYLGLLFVGIPIVSRLGRSIPMKLTSITVIGAFSGVLVIFVFIAMLSVLFGVLPSLNIESVIMGATLGALVAFSYSLIAGPKSLN